MNVKNELKFIDKCREILIRCKKLERLMEKCEAEKNYFLFSVYHRADNRYNKIYNMLKQKEILKILKRTGREK